MLKMALDRLILQNMRKGSDDNYKEYASRWKEVALLVEPPLTNREVNSLFMDIIPSLYYDKLIGNVFLKFSYLLYFVGQIE